MYGIACVECDECAVSCAEGVQHEGSNYGVQKDLELALFREELAAALVQSATQPTQTTASAHNGDSLALSAHRDAHSS